ncbi:MAG: MmcQ/YjbR family DNA-binding protein [Phycisphaerales bacterium]
MKIQSLIEFCRSLPGATEDIKWGDNLVFSVGGKMFAGFQVEGGWPVGFPCSDEDFEALTARPGIIPAPYAARFGWVSVREDGALSQAEAKRFLSGAYGIVLAKLPKRAREAIGAAARGAGSSGAPLTGSRRRTAGGSRRSPRR